MCTLYTKRTKCALITSAIRNGMANEYIGHEESCIQLTKTDLERRNWSECTHCIYSWALACRRNSMPWQQQWKSEIHFSIYSYLQLKWQWKKGKQSHFYANKSQKIWRIAVFNWSFVKCKWLSIFFIRFHLQLFFVSRFKIISVHCAVCASSARCNNLTIA